MGCALAVIGVSVTVVPAAPAATRSSTVWLCKPGIAHNPCESSLATTVIGANGSRIVDRARTAPNPPIDCFYVYPTVSGQRTVNANLNVGPEEISVAENQVAPFSSVCRVYAPMYRQLTIAAITNPGSSLRAAGALAYADVRSAWRDYLTHDNHGRGVVLISHSQGTALLVPLLRSEVDPQPAVRRRVVSALLLGGNVTVPAGSDVGGDFQHLPACRTVPQTGCVIAYSSFNAPPPPNSLFGRAGEGVSNLVPRPAGAVPLQVLCVNPAALGGGSGALRPFFTTRPVRGPLGAVTRPAATVTTPWVEFPGLYTAQCHEGGGATWLQVDDVGGPSDHRPRVTAVLGPAWGLHLVDVNIALGNLVDVVRAEAAAYRR